MNRIITTTLLLALFAFIGVGLVALTHLQTHDKIIDQIRIYKLRNINKILPKTEYDNNILADTIVLPEPTPIGLKPGAEIYRARKAATPVAVFLTAIAPDGYNGDIELLIGIRYNGEIAGVRIITQKETPGLGDAIDQDKTDWILGFDNTSLLNTTSKGWNVKKNGGRFDQFTGATVSPRAVVKAVKKTLEYVQSNRDTLYVKSEKKKPSKKEKRDH